MAWYRYRHIRDIANHRKGDLDQGSRAHDCSVQFRISGSINYLTDANISARVDLSESVVQPYMRQSPDIDHNANFVSSSGASIAASVGGNLKALKTRFGIPMPPDMKDP